MVKLIIAFISIATTIYGSSQSTLFDCKFYTGGWGTLGKVYRCDLQNTVSITSQDEAKVDGITGTHLVGYSNDNVEAFSVYHGTINYLPRNLSKLFKNLRGIQIHGTGLKEIHKSDLKPFTKLINLYLDSNNLEILEENLLEFHPNLELLSIYNNKISHIDPNLFNKLTKLNMLLLNTNTCINMDAYDNPTKVQNVIQAAKTQCSNSDYLNLDLKIKKLKLESKQLDADDLKNELKNLENEIENSKFSNFFQDKLKNLKATKVETTTTTTQQPTTTKAPTIIEDIKIETCSALESKVDNITTTLKDLLEKSSNDTCCKEQCEGQNESLETKLEILEENMENTRTMALRDIKNLRNEVKTDHGGILASFSFRTDKIEKKVEELSQKVDEKYRKVEDKLVKIMKALNIGD